MSTDLPTTRPASMNTRSPRTFRHWGLVWLTIAFTLAAVAGAVAAHYLSLDLNTFPVLGK